MKKKVLITMLLTITVITVNAQYRLTSKGLVNDTDKGYIVLEFNDKTQQELYNAVHLLINSTYVSPQNVLSIVDGQSITINGVSLNAIYRKNPIIKTFDINYTITFLFKNGRIRIDNPNINRLNASGTSVAFYINGSYMFQDGVFNKKGKVLAEKTKKSIENFFNMYLSDIKKAVESEEMMNW